MLKSLKSISWDVDEPTYRKDPSLSQSIISKYNREGFANLDHLYDRDESPSLLFGSVVDCLITEPSEFNNRYIIADSCKVKDSSRKILTVLLADDTYASYKNLSDISKEDLLRIMNDLKYYPNYKDENRIKTFLDDSSVFWKLQQESKGKTIIDKSTYDDATACVTAIKESKATNLIFSNTPFDDKEVLYQIKFKGDYNKVPLKMMADILVVDHAAKIIYPFDLKTTHGKEYEFPKSFIKWRYMYQAGIYWYLIQQNLSKDPYFKDFKIDNYRFLVVNRTSRTPLIWLYNGTQTIIDYKFGDTVIPNWRSVVTELYGYLKFPVSVPNEIDVKGDNCIDKYLNDYESK